MGAADHDAGVGLLHDAGVQERLGMLVRGRGAVDLRRHDGVGDVEILVARPLVEAHDVVAEAAGRPRSKSWRQPAKPVSTEAT